MYKSIDTAFGIEMEKYYDTLCRRAFLLAPSESEVRSPVQGDFNAETLASITIANLKKYVLRNGMPRHFWIFALQQLEWVRCAEYRKMKRREELFIKIFGNHPVDASGMDQNEDEEGQLCV